MDYLENARHFRRKGEGRKTSSSAGSLQFIAFAGRRGIRLIPDVFQIHSLGFVPAQEGY